MTAVALSLAAVPMDGRLYALQGAVSYSQLPTLPVVSGVAWLLQPVVRVLNSDGSLNTSYVGPITLRSNGTLSGTTTVLAVAGVATFVGISLTGAGTYTLTAEVPLFGVIDTTITVS